MKYITLIIGLLVVGCGTPVKELTLEEKVVGTYEYIKDGDTIRMVFLENGIWEGYENGKKEDGEGKWKITKEGEIHIIDGRGDIDVVRINKDGSITAVAGIDKDGKREDLISKRQPTFKRIK